MPNGRCRMHGGKSTGPPQGNKNAVKTGEYETIWMDVLEPEERVLFYAVDTDVLKQLDEEIRLITIRERRMLQRIEALKKQQHVLDEISESSEFGTTKRYVDTTIRIQQIEEALTRVQEKKTKLLELKHKILSQGAPDKDDINDQITALADLINNPAPDRVMDDV